MIGRAKGVEKALGSRRGKDLADRYRIYQPWTDIAEKGRFMTRAAAGNDTDAPLLRRPVFADDPWITVTLCQFGVRDQNAAQHVLDHLVRIVYHSVHNAISCVLFIRIGWVKVAERPSMICRHAP
ncbi:hypothetical protein ALO43_200384 [Pseudomonas tremae]|uniref:Isoflavone reductase n=1 Tax=Pseudomonas tremae TaxID=200454 RepID=A0AA40P216_9PSED|nr:hypothetical protein ALO43_200384 [Pseudomonas tremae]